MFCVSVDDISTILGGGRFPQKTMEITRKLMEKDHQIICKDKGVLGGAT
jgi:hypothetical protein